MEGILEKPSRIPGKTTKVWSVLDDKTLSFFQENKRSICIGSVELEDIQKVNKVSECQFNVVTDLNSQTYTASSPEQCREWIEILSKFSSGQSEAKSRVRQSLAILGTLKSARDIFENKQPDSIKASYKQFCTGKNQTEVNETTDFGPFGTNHMKNDSITRYTRKHVPSPGITEKEECSNSLDGEGHKAEASYKISDDVVGTTDSNTNTIPHKHNIDLKTVRSIFNSGTANTSSKPSKQIISSTNPKTSNQKLSCFRNSDPSSSNLAPTLYEVRSRLHSTGQTTQSFKIDAQLDAPELTHEMNRLKQISSTKEGKDKTFLGKINISDNKGNTVMNSVKSRNNVSERINEKGENSILSKMNETSCDNANDSFDGSAIAEEGIANMLSKNTIMTSVRNLGNSNMRSVSGDQESGQCNTDSDVTAEEPEHAVVVMRKSNRSVSVSRSDVVTQLPSDESNTEDSNNVFAFPNTKRRKKSSVKYDHKKNEMICENAKQSNQNEKEKELQMTSTKEENVESVKSDVFGNDDVDGSIDAISLKQNVFENYPDVDSLLNSLNFTSAPPLPNNIPNRADHISFHELKLTLDDLESDDDHFDESVHGEDIIEKLSKLVEC